MNTNKTQIKITKAGIARVSSFLTVGLIVFGPDMRPAKAWAADVAPILNPAGVTWTATVDWASISADYDPLGDFFSMNLLGGLNLDVSTNDGEFERRTQGTSWLGCFEIGDALLWKKDGTDAITVSFNAPMTAVGACVQNDYYGMFSGWIEAFDFHGSSLGVHSIGGLADYCDDGTAPFLGFTSDSPNIYSVQFGVNHGQQLSPSDSFAINSLLLRYDEPLDTNNGNHPSLPAITPVPEAGPMAAASVFGLLLLRWTVFRPKKATTA